MKETINCFLQLVRREVVIFLKEYVSKFIDTGFVLITTIVVFGYFMVKSGLSGNYGAFILVGAAASFGLFEVIGRVSVLIADMTSDRVISNFLNLPISSGFVSATFSFAFAFLA